MLPLSLPNRQMTGAAAPSDQTALERTCPRILCNAGQPPGEESRVTGGSAATKANAARDTASTGAGLRVKGPFTPNPKGRQKVQQREPGKVMTCVGCFYYILWKPPDPASSSSALITFRLTERERERERESVRPHMLCLWPLGPHCGYSDGSVPARRTGLLCCGRRQGPQAER